VVDAEAARVRPPADHPEWFPVSGVVASLTKAFGPPPEVAIVLGSGLGGLVARTQVEGRASYASLGLPTAGVVGHSGELVVGTLGGRRVAVMSGRVHLYEGWTPAELVRGVRAMALWGVGGLVLTNSVGAVGRGLHPGDLVVLNDHINLMGTSPLIGRAWGTRFPDPTRLYPAAGREALRAAAREAGVPVHEGVYVAMHGPAYETPAEVRMLSRLGADVVGMSTVPEALAGLEVGMRVHGLAVVSNYASGVVQGPIDHSQVTIVAGKAADDVVKVLEGAIHAL
jgi:purine-nucleoside phosphorylase